MSNWKKAILKPSDTIVKAIQVLDKEALRIVMVSDDDERLLGTVTDGDIRRAILKSQDMNTTLNKVMFKKPTVAFVEDDKKTILTIMKNKDLFQIPILNKDRKIVGLETIKHIFKSDRLDNPIFLMAGGFGKRLKPLTNDIPKPLLNVGDKPILEIILKNFIEAGFYNFFISTHYKAEMVQQHFGDGSKWGVQIQYVHEEKPLGTAGALSLLPETLPNLPIIMMNGDLLTKLNFKQLLDFHIEQDGIATMCVREYDYQVPYGVIEVEENKVKNIVEKPVHKFFINAGIYVINPSLFNNVNNISYLDMPHLLESNIKQGHHINMFPIHEYWLDIGRMDEYERANQEVKDAF